MLLMKKIVSCHFINLPPTPKGLCVSFPWVFPPCRVPRNQGEGAQGSQGEPRSSPGILGEEEEVLCR